MSAQNPALSLRQKVVVALKNDAALIAKVPVARIYGEYPGATPARPFVRYGEDDANPRRVSCWEGAEIAFPVHSFSAQPFTDEVRQIDAAIVAALDGKVLDLGDGLKATITWAGTQLLRDGADANAWHGFNQFVATC